MSGNKKQYDLVCSLGGNCAAAHNLRYRNMRLYSLPFDWCFAKNEKPIEYLCEGFKNNFKDLALKENLEEVKETGYAGVHNNKIPYFDKHSGYYFLNHFEQRINEQNSYLNFYNKYRRRIGRLQNKIKTSQNILFILSTTTEFDISCIERLRDELKSIYPNKNFDFIIISFSCTNDETYITKENITVYKYKRCLNQYDFTCTNFEWSFLDNIKIRDKDNKFVEIKKIKKTWCIYFLKRISTIFRIQLYLFGLRFDICIGKVKNK